MKLNEDFTTRSKIKDVGRWYVTQFVVRVSGGLPPGTSVLDAGAGECAYKRLFRHCRYTSVDLAVGQINWNYHNLDCVALLQKLPFKDSAFDAILCTEVLEHLEWPRETLEELYRILKPDGKLFLTAPMSHAEHQAPYDFFRYTSFGLRSICRHAKFIKIEINPFGGIFMRMAYELPRILSVLPDSGITSGNLRISGIMLLPVKVFSLILVRMIQIALIGMDRFDKIRNDPLGWSVIAKK